MWIMLNNAFISVVQDRDDPTLLLARARVKGDLERVFGPIVKPDVKRTVDADYRYRLTIERWELRDALTQAATGIDYPNFKDSVKEKDRAGAYLRCWTALLDLQDQREGEHGHAPPLRGPKRTRRVSRAAPGGRAAPT